MLGFIFRADLVTRPAEHSHSEGKKGCVWNVEFYTLWPCKAAVVWSSLPWPSLLPVPCCCDVITHHDTLRWSTSYYQVFNIVPCWLMVTQNIHQEDHQAVLNAMSTLLKYLPLKISRLTAVLCSPSSGKLFVLLRSFGLTLCLISYWSSPLRYIEKMHTLHSQNVFRFYLLRCKNSLW